MYVLMYVVIMTLDTNTQIFRIHVLAPSNVCTTTYICCLISQFPNISQFLISQFSNMNVLLKHPCSPASFPYESLAGLNIDA